MPVTFVDQLMAFVSTPVNLTTFIADTGIAAYAGASFTRRYGQSGFQVDSVALGTPVDFELQQPILDDLRIMGTEQRTDSSSGRKLYDLRYHRQQVIGWVDASFTVPADFNAELIPGSAPLGPGGSVTQGTTTECSARELPDAVPGGSHNGCIHPELPAAGLGFRIGRPVSNSGSSEDTAGKTVSRERSGVSRIPGRIDRPASLVVRTELSRRGRRRRAHHGAGSRAVVRCRRHTRDIFYASGINRQPIGREE